MSNSIFWNLATTNIKSSKRTYLPYFISGIFTVCAFYLMLSLAFDKGIASLQGGDNVRMLLFLGAIVIAIFTVIFLCYTSSFISKQRRKGFAVYGLLGMEKKHIAKVMWFESLISFVIVLGGGLIAGIVLNKLIYMLLLNVAGANASYKFAVHPIALILTGVLIAGIFLLTLLAGIAKVGFSSPIELLHSDNTGEKEPKSKWLLAIIGIVCMVAGYYMALSFTSVIDAIQIFFIAVILVIIGTYLLFTAGSIAVLKLMKKNKDYYYKPNHFISVSGMIYRMKQNAVGLANICILATIVIILASTSVALYAGQNDLFNTMFSSDIALTSSGNASAQQLAAADSRLDKMIDKYGVHPQDMYKYRFASAYGSLKGNDLTLTQDTSAISLSVDLIAQKDWTVGKPADFDLAKNEIGVYSKIQNKPIPSKMTIGDKTYTVKKLKSFRGNMRDSTTEGTIFIVMPSRSAVADIFNAELSNYSNMTSAYIAFDLRASDTAANKAFCKSIYNDPVLSFAGNSVDSASASTQVQVYGADVKSLERSGFYAIYGGFLFLCVFLAVVFLMSTVVTMYYKQVSEGIQDKRRYSVMQKVGMSLDEVKKSIKSQVLAVFFLPLAVAVIHVTGASKLMFNLLRLLGLNNLTIFTVSTIVSIGIFALIYLIMYTLTSRKYYRIVKIES